MCVGECVCVSCGRVYVSNRSNVTKRLIQMMSARKNRYASGNGNGNDSSSDAGSSVTHTRHPHQPTACPRCPHPLPRQVHPFPPTCAHTYEQAKQAETRRAEGGRREGRHKQQACETHEDARCCSARVTVTTTPNDVGSDAALTLLLLRHIKYIFALSQQQQQLHEYEQQQKQSTSSHVTYTEKIYRMYLCVCVRVYEIHLHTHA